MAVHVSELGARIGRFVHQNPKPRQIDPDTEAAIRFLTPHTGTVGTPLHTVLDISSKTPTVVSRTPLKGDQSIWVQKNAAIEVYRPPVTTLAKRAR